MADESKRINDEELKKVAGGTDPAKGRTATGTVVGPGVSSEHIYLIKADDGRDIAAYYYAIGKLLEPGTRVKVELVGQAQWEIIEFL